MDPILFPKKPRAGAERRAESLAGQRSLFGGEEPPPEAKREPIQRVAPKRVLYLGGDTITLRELNELAVRGVVEFAAKRVDLVVVDWDQTAHSKQRSTTDPSKEVTMVAVEEMLAVITHARSGREILFVGRLQHHHTSVNRVIDSLGDDASSFKRLNLPNPRRRRGESSESFAKRKLESARAHRAKLRAAIFES